MFCFRPQFASALAALIAFSIVSVPTETYAQDGWTSSDVGDVGMPGGAVYDRGTWTVQGAGADVWHLADAFHFLYQRSPFYGGKIMVRVDSLTDTHPFAKAGLMFRRSTDPDAVTVTLSAKPNGELELLGRFRQGFETRYISGLHTSGPVWLELMWGSSQGGQTSIVFASASTDGVSWTRVGLLPVVPMNTGREVTEGPLVGAFVTSHDVNTLNTAQFSGLSLLPVIGNGDGLEFLRVTDVGVTGLPGSAVHTGGAPGEPVRALTLQGAGADVWDTADSFAFAHIPFETNVTVTTEVQAFDAAHPFAKAGVMIRDGLASDAPHVILSVKPDNEIEFMTRMCAACETTYVGGMQVTLPVSLALTRKGKVISAEVRLNDGSVTQLGTVTLDLPGRVHAGAVVTSHDVGQLATAALTLSFAVPAISIK